MSISSKDDVQALFDLRDRVGVVTGASRGIGLAIAKGFAAAGAQVVVASRKAEACEEAVREIEAAGGRALAVPTHVGDPEQLERLVARTVEHFGQLDILVNNAANALALPIGQITLDAWAKTQDANERAPLLLVQYALEYLTDSPHASVINMVSAGVFTHGGYLAMYVAAKSGLLALTRSMAAELIGRGIRVNALAPGSVDTDMMRNNRPEVQERLEKSSLMARFADPDEMVGPALFLASDASSYVTGSVLLADGGLVFH